MNLGESLTPPLWARSQTPARPLALCLGLGRGCSRRRHSRPPRGPVPWAGCPACLPTAPAAAGTDRGHQRCNESSPQDVEGDLTPHFTHKELEAQVSRLASGKIQQQPQAGSFLTTLQALTVGLKEKHFSKLLGCVRQCYFTVLDDLQHQET